MLKRKQKLDNLFAARNEKKNLHADLLPHLILVILDFITEFSFSVIRNKYSKLILDNCSSK